MLGELTDAVVFVFVQHYGVHIADVPVSVIKKMSRHPEVCNSVKRGPGSRT